MSLSTLRTAALSEQESTFYFAMLQILRGISDASENFQNYARCLGPFAEMTHAQFVAAIGVEFAGVNNATVRFKLLEQADEYKTQFKAIIANAMDPIAAEHGIPITGHKQFGYCNANGTRPWDPHTFVRSLRQAIIDSTNLYKSTITHKMQALQMEGDSRPKQRAATIIQVIVDYAIFIGRPYTPQEIITIWIQVLPPDQQDLRRVVWENMLVANPNADPWTYINAMVSEEARIQPTKQALEMDNLVFSIFDPPSSFALNNTSPIGGVLSAFALKAGISPKMISAFICSSCDSASKARAMLTHPKPEFSLPCKIPGCAGTVPLDPNAPCPFHIGAGHTNSQCKIVNNVASRFSNVSVSTASASVRGGGGSAPSSKKTTLALTIVNLDFERPPDFPEDPALFDGCSQVSLLSQEMLSSYGERDSMIDTPDLPVSVSGVSGEVQVTTQVTLKNSSLMAYVLPTGFPLEYPIICEDDLFRKSWDRNSINGLPYLTHPSLPPVRLFRNNKHIFVSFSALFTPQNMN